MKNIVLTQKIMIAFSVALFLLTIFTLEEDASLSSKLLSLSVPILLVVIFLLNLKHYKKQNQND